MTNPWMLSPREAETMDVLISTGSNKVAARQMGISHRTVELYLCCVLRKMGVKSRVVAAVQWDRFTRQKEAA